MDNRKSIDVDTFVDGLKFGRAQFWVVALCTILVMIDGYELYVVGWVLPKLADDFDTTRTALTPILVAQQIGMVIGAYTMTPLADKIGRTKVLFICFTGISLTCVFILGFPNIAMLTVCRLITGAFASAMVPILLSIVTETAPKRLRATMGTICVSGALGGAFIGSFMQAFLLEPYGWTSAFWLALVMPIMMLPLIWFLLPETLRYMIAKNPKDPRIPTMIKRMAPDAGDIELHAPVREQSASEQITQKPKNAFIHGLFGEGRVWRTIALWLAFMSSLTYISAGSWKTTIFRDVVGLDWQQVALTTALGVGFGIVGNISVGIAIDRWGFRRVLPSVFLVAAVCIIVMGAATHMLGTFFFLWVLVSIFQHGGQAGLASLATSIYPSHQRATGVGWAYGAGRFASIFAPMLGALALSQNYGALTLFTLFSLPLASAALWIFVLLSDRKVEARRQPKHV